MNWVAFIIFFYILLVSAQSSYPAPGAVPIPKPEWLELLKNATITPAPVLKSVSDGGPSISGKDEYCNWAKSGCIGSSLYSCPQGEWGLTFDDGPSTFSPALYDFLKSTKQKSTLFMIGANIVKNPEIAKRAHAEGHEIAIHTWSHPFLTTLTNEKVVAELKWTELAIQDIIGVSPRFFRPPYGDIDNRIRDIGTALGFTSVLWDHDTNDWMLAENVPGFSEKHIDGNFTEWVKEANNSTTGGLSLEHDIQKITVDIAIRNLPALQKAYNVVSVGECAKQSPYKESNTTTAMSLPTNETTTSVVTSASLTHAVTLTPTADIIPDSGTPAVLYSELLLLCALIICLI